MKNHHIDLEKANSLGVTYMYDWHRFVQHLYDKPMFLCYEDRASFLSFYCPICQDHQDHRWYDSSQRIIKISMNSSGHECFQSDYYLKITSKDDYMRNWLFPINFELAKLHEDKGYLETCKQSRCLVKICPSNKIYQFRHRLVGWLSFCSIHYQHYIPEIFENILYPYSDRFMNELKDNPISPRCHPLDTQTYFDITHCNLAKIEMSS